MTHSVVLHPFGFPQRTRIASKIEKRSDTPIPPDDSYRSVRPSPAYPKSRSHRVSIPDDSFRPLSSQRSGTQPTFLDEEEEDAIRPQPRRRLRTSQKRPPSHLQSSRHVQDSNIISPITPTTKNKLAQLHIPSEMPTTIREAFSEKQLQEQIKEVYSALRRVEDDREKILNYMKAGRADQCRIERELEETRRENQRLTARLEEMLRSSKMKSPLSAKSDDCWGCSMYDMEAEGH